MQKLAVICVCLSLTLGACAAPSPTLAPTASVPPPPSPTPFIFPTPLPTTPPQPTATEPSLFPPVLAADWQQGPAAAPVTLVVYNDFQCGYCAYMAGMLSILRQEYPDDLRLVFRHFPLPQNDKAHLAAQAAEAAGAQGQFWPMHDILFFRQDEWYDLPPVDFRLKLTAYAEELGLDVATFNQALDAETYAQAVEAARREALAIPILGTPFILFNGEPYEDRGELNHWSLSTLIRLELLKSRQYTAPPPDVIDPLKQYVATLKTAKGDIVIQLYADQAPVTVNNFVFLARAGWYNGNTFFRVITDTLVQTGDPTNTGLGSPGYFVLDELAPGARFDGPGWVGMANAAADTNGSQFFITLTALPELDGRYTRFGKVIQGLEVLAQLTPRDPSLNPEAPLGDVLETIEIEER